MGPSEEVVLSQQILIMLLPMLSRSVLLSGLWLRWFHQWAEALLSWPLRNKAAHVSYSERQTGAWRKGQLVTPSISVQGSRGPGALLGLPGAWAWVRVDKSGPHWQVQSHWCAGWGKQACLENSQAQLCSQSCPWGQVQWVNLRH